MYVFEINNDQGAFNIIIKPYTNNKIFILLFILK